MSKLIDITDISDSELDALLGMDERTVSSVVTAPGPMFVVTTTHYSDGSMLVVTKCHADGYTTAVLHFGSMQ